VYSAGKAYAATAVGVLMDEGKLKVDDTACLYLPEWAGDDRRKITIRHLLTMTSGLKLDYEGFTATENPTAATLGWPLERPPGTAWSYEQATAHAVGLIVQRVTGQQPIVFQRFVSEHPVVREHWATPGTTVTFDARGRAIVDAAFAKPGAAIVFFGAQP